MVRGIGVDLCDIERMKKASINELCEVKGVNKELAKKIKEI